MTSHGHEPATCGALGFGDPYQGARLRGMVAGPFGLRQDNGLLPVADLRGREVWFEPEKKDWLQYLHRQAVDIYSENPEVYNFYDNILNNANLKTMFSEWVEQEGRHWNDGPQNSPRDLNCTLCKSTSTAGVKSESLYI